MAEFKEMLNEFVRHYDKLNVIGEEADEGFNAEFMVCYFISLALHVRTC